MNRLLALLLMLLAVPAINFSQEPAKQVPDKQFIYVLKLIPRLLVKENWTKEDGVIVGKHFRRLQQAHKEGRVILAGKTTNDDDPSQFGVVIFLAPSESEARTFMEGDDAVKEKIMTAQLFPFVVGLGK